MKQYLAFFDFGILDADIYEDKGIINVLDSNGEFNGFCGSFHSFVNCALPNGVARGSLIHHRVSESSTLVVELTDSDCGQVAFIIEVDIPDDGSSVDELYLCPVCGFSGPHVCLPRHMHYLSSDGRVTPVQDESPKVSPDTITACDKCHYYGEKRDFHVKCWKDASALMQKLQQTVTQ